MMNFLYRRPTGRQFFPHMRRDATRDDPILSQSALRDRYVIRYFSAESKFMHMFSNVAEIPPIFPSTAAIWQKLMWGEPFKKE